MYAQVCVCANVHKCGSLGGQQSETAQLQGQCTGYSFPYLVCFYLHWVRISITSILVSS